MNHFSFYDQSGKEYLFDFEKRYTFELGEFYLGKRIILFHILKEHESFFNNGVNILQGIKYQSKMMEQNFKCFIPRDIKIYQSDYGFVMTVYKDVNQINLTHLLKLQVSSKTLSWILSGLYHFALFMEQSQYKSFGGFSLDGIFVNLSQRTVQVLSGWWYSQSLSNEVTTLEDQQTIKKIGLQLINEQTNDHIIHFLHKEPNDHFIQDYSEWLQVEQFI